jgi:hypothetical protein
MMLVSGFTNSIQIKCGKKSSCRQRRFFSKTPQLITQQELATPFIAMSESGIPCAFLTTKAHNPEEAAMSQPTNILKPSTDDIPREVLDLIDAVRALPETHRQAIEPLLTRMVDSNRRRRRILVLVQDALSQLRLDMKYLAFDLEATRRERDDFRRKLNETA